MEECDESNRSSPVSKKHQSLEICSLEEELIARTEKDYLIITAKVNATDPKEKGRMYIFMRRTTDRLSAKFPLLGCPRLTVEEMKKESHAPGWFGDYPVSEPFWFCTWLFSPELNFRLKLNGEQRDQMEHLCRRGRYV